MTGRGVVSSSKLCRLMEGRWPPAPASSLRYYGESKGRMFSEEERAKETVYIQKMEREKMEKLNKKKEAEQQKADKDKKAEEGPHKI